MFGWIAIAAALIAFGARGLTAYWDRRCLEGIIVSLEKAVASEILDDGIPEYQTYYRVTIARALKGGGYVGQTTYDVSQATFQSLYVGSIWGPKQGQIAQPVHQH